MGDFSIKTDKVKLATQELTLISKKLKKIERQCDDVKKKLKFSNSSFDSVKTTLTRIISQIEDERMSADELSDNLYQIIQLYENAEKEILKVYPNESKIKEIINKSKDTIQDLLKELNKIIIGILKSICAYAGDPVNMCNGNYLDCVVELNFVNGLRLSFVRYYNSVASTNGMLGMGWRHNYEVYLDLKESEIILTSEMGIERFVIQSDYTYISNYGNCELIRGIENGYEWLREDGLIYQFDKNGKLIRISDKKNNAITLEYVNEKLRSATDQYGNVLKYKYNDSGYISEVCDNRGRNVTFEYERAYLSKVISIVGKVREYGYDEMGRLCTYYLPDGSIDFSIFYDNEDRVIKQIFADESEMLYEYEEDTVIYTNEKGHKTKYYHDKKGRHIRTEYADQSEENYEYDKFNHRVLRVDRNGASYSRVFDNKGNITHVTDACGYETEYYFKDAAKPTYVTHPDGSNVFAEYDEMDNLISLTDEMGANTIFSYNQFGQMICLCREDGAKRNYTYDKRGNLSSITDENNCTILYEYDQYDNLQKKTDANGNVTKFDYRLDGKLISITNAINQKRRFKYDIYGNLVEVIDFDGLRENRNFDCRNRMISYTDKVGNTTNYEYDEASNLTQVILPNGGLITYEYDLMDNLIKMKLPDGEITQYEYNKFGDMISVKKGEFERHFEYNESHLLIKCYDNIGHYQEAIYDFRGHILTVTSESGRDKKCEYDKCGRCISVEDILGRRMNYEYDRWGNLVAIIDAIGRKVSYVYDNVGLLKKTIYPNGNWISYTYDNNRNLISKFQQDGYELFYDYDALDRTVAIYDNQNHRVELEYNASGKVSSRIDGMGNVTNYTYTENGMLKSVIDALGNEMTYSYDEMNMLREVCNEPEFGEEKVTKIIYDRTLGGKIQTITDALGSYKHYEYDFNGNMIRVTDEQNMVTDYYYDLVGRVQKVSFPDENVASFVYDSHGRMTEMSDWNGRTKFTYDLAGRMIQSINPRGQKIEYNWGLADELLEMVYPGGEKVTYMYDDLVRRTAVFTDDLKVSYKYNENGRLKEKIFNNGSKQSYCYNASGQVYQCNNYYSDGMIKNTIFSYDLLGNKIGKKIYNKVGELVGGEKYAFDALNRLTSVTSIDGSKTSIEYDGRGNRIRMISPLEEVDYTYNELNQLMELKVQNIAGEKEVTNYTYDTFGNLRTEEMNGKAKEYIYDSRGRLIEVYGEGIPKISYVYDMLGHRLSEEITSHDVKSKTDYIVDYSNPLQRIIGIETTEKRSNYLWGDSLTGSFSGKSSDDVQYFMCDELGSIVGVQNSKGYILREYEYDPFGNLVQGDEVNNYDEQVSSPFGFTGYLKESIGGHYYANAREYVPQIGRFIMQDDHRYMYLNQPQSLNLYHYCLNNPVVFIDPSGNDCYIFYLPEWKNEAKNDRRQLANEYNCSIDEVHLVPITDKQSLTDGWNAMGTENGQTVDIDCVVINSHANPYVLGFGESGNPAFGASDIAALDDKDVEQMILYGCNAGHADYSNSNPAAEFSKKVNGAPVLASDGTVYSGFSFLNLFKRNYKSEADKHFKDYLQDGERDNNGWMVYQYEDGKVNTTDIGDKKMNVTEMTKTLNQYMPDCERRSS